MMAIDDRNLPAILKEVRTQLALTQEDLARILAVDISTVKRMFARLRKRGILGPRADAALRDRAGANDDLAPARESPLLGAARRGRGWS